MKPRKPRENLLFFSLDDLVKLLDQGKILIAVACLLCASLTFVYKIIHPVHYTVEGIFKGHVSGAENRFFKALEFLGGDESYVHAEDPRTFLRSYPILCGVVKALNLQATITETSRGGRFREVWYTLKTAHYYRRLKKERPPSNILGGSIYVPDRLIIPDPQASVVCLNLDFAQETSDSLTIHFLSQTTYKVKKGSRVLGTGSLDIPFVWEKGTFTLSGTGSKGNTIGLHFIPLPQAVQSLQNSLNLTRNKENLSLIHIRYTHRDRHIASQIVNESMEQFQIYLTQEGKKKIAKQLSYLHSRQEESLQQLEAVLSKQKAYLESQLDAGLILSLEQELTFMAQTQAQKRHKLLEIQSEIEYLANNAAPFSELLDNLIHQNRAEETHTLSVESAHDMIHYHQKELDGLLLDQERYDYCMAKLEESTFDCSSLAKILNDPSLQARFEKVHSLHHRIIDTKNWSAKEREQLNAELATEKAFLKEYTGQLKEGAQLHAQAIQKRIHTLHHNLLFLLTDRYTQELSTLSALAEQAKHFPEKWLNEQKIALKTKMYTEIMESITKMIEAKNIGYNLDYLLAQVLKPATPPVLPDPPRLLLNTCLGGFFGALCTFLGLLGWGIWKGPSASFHNLLSMGKQVFPPSDTIGLLGLELSEAGPTILLTAPHQLEYDIPLIHWLEKKGEKIKVIDLRTSDLCSPGKAPFLASPLFHEELISYQREYDRTILMATGSVQGFVIQALLKHADAIIYEAAGEPLVSLDALPAHTLFVIQNHPNLQSIEPILPLSALVPKLERLLLKMKRSSFSVAQNAWRQAFPSQKT